MQMQISGALELVSQLRDELPVAVGPVSLARRRAGLVIIDEQRGFATVGGGALAPAACDDIGTRSGR